MTEYLPGPYTVQIGGTAESPLVGVNFTPAVMSFIVMPAVALPDEALATAHLVAASPDMYEALTIVDAALDRIGVHVPEVKSALSRAKGRI